MKIWLPVVVVVAGGVAFFFRPPLPSPDEARKLATGTFEKYAQEESIDSSLFEGPKRHAMSNIPYAFEWTYADQEGKLTVLVLVDRGGWTKISFDVNDSYDGSQAAIDRLDRLTRLVKERSRSGGVRRSE
jgi:hypothetical protein